MKSGQGADKRRKYIYFEKLLFLLPTVQNRETLTNVGNDSAGSEDETENDNLQVQEPLARRHVGHSRRQNRKRNYEESLLELLKEKKRERDTTEADEDVNFALSLVPILRSLDDATKIDAKIQILSLLKSLKFGVNNQLPHFSPFNMNQSYNINGQPQMYSPYQAGMSGYNTCLLYTSRCV